MSKKEDKSKVLYREFCREGNVPLFFHPDWLDAVCGDLGWSAAVYIDELGTVRGIWPFAVRQLLGWQVSRMPPLTPYLGVWLNYPKGMSNLHNRRSFERKVTYELLGQLPPFLYFHQAFLPSFFDWLPLYWNGFHQQAYYTYEIHPDVSFDALFHTLKGNVRNKIRKASGQLVCEESEALFTLYSLVEKSFQRQRMRVPFSFSQLQGIDDVLSRMNSRRIYLAKDQLGRYVAAIYLVWDDEKMYNLILGTGPEGMQSGAVPFLLWRSIQDAVIMGRIFDFEGSMIKGVEQLFHSFGGKQRSYFSIFKGRNKLIETAAFFFRKRL